MPWVSDAQRRWGNSPAGIQAMGAAKVAEFNAATKGMSLKERVQHAVKRAVETVRTNRGK